MVFKYMLRAYDTQTVAVFCIMIERILEFLKDYNFMKETHF